VDESVIGSRIEEYERKTTQVADHYKQQNKVVYVPGEGSVEDIFSRLCQEIDKRQAQKA